MTPDRSRRKMLPLGDAAVRPFSRGEHIVFAS